MAPHLIRMEGDAQGKAYPIDRARLVIGRGDEADIKLESRYASRNHAEMHYADGIYTLYVPEGKQVLLNGAAVAGQARMTPGDVIDFPEERFTFGEVRIERGTPRATAKKKIDPIRIVMVLLVLGGGGFFAYEYFNYTTWATAPEMSAPFDVEDLKALAAPYPELRHLQRDVFYRGDYTSAMDRLDKAGSLDPEDRRKIRNVILGLVRRRMSNEYAAGRDYFRTQQFEAARTNFNTVARLARLFEAEDRKEAIPQHPRLVDARGNQVTYTVDEAIKHAEDYIRRCDAILEGRPDPGPAGQAEQGG